jgi:PAS domain S-box-containing protein
MSIDALVPERLRKRHRADRTRFAAEPRSREMGAGLELFAVAADGREFRVEISLSPLLGESEGLVMAAVRDITERVNAEAAARQIRDILDATRDAMTILDADTLRFTYVNNGAVQQVGYARDELLNMTMLHITPEFDAATLRKLLAPLASGEVSSALVNTVHRHRDGEDIPVEILFQAVPGEDGLPRSYVKIARDITERQEAEANLRRAEQELRLLEDRERIARDLHDVVIQRLFASGLTLEAALSQITDPAIVRRLSPIVDELDDAIKDLRSTIFRLRARPRTYTPRADLLRVIEEQQPALGFEPRVHLDGPIDAIPDAVLTELLPTLREALANVARHAHATRVSVAVTAGDVLDLRVEDDGHGIEPDHRHGDGIRNAALRAEALGGAFDVHRGVEGGTVLTWSVPLVS